MSAGKHTSTTDSKTHFGRHAINQFTTCIYRPQWFPSRLVTSQFTCTYFKLYIRDSLSLPSLKQTASKPWNNSMDRVNSRPCRGHTEVIPARGERTLWLPWLMGQEKSAYLGGPLENPPMSSKSSSKSRCLLRDEEYLSYELFCTFSCSIVFISENAEWLLALKIMQEIQLYCHNKHVNTPVYFYFRN